MINYWLLLLVMPVALSKKMSREAGEPSHPDNQPERKKSERGGRSTLSEAKKRGMKNCGRGTRKETASAM